MGEASGEIPHTATRVDSQGHTRPARKGRPRTAKRMPAHPNIPVVVDPNAATALEPHEYTSSTESQAPKLDPIDEITETAAAAPVPSAAVSAGVRKAMAFIIDDVLSDLKDEEHGQFVTELIRALKAVAAAN
jgi:hypothetical protein